MCGNTKVTCRLQMRTIHNNCMCELTYGQKFYSHNAGTPDYVSMGVAAHMGIWSYVW